MFRSMLLRSILGSMLLRLVCMLRMFLPLALPPFLLTPLLFASLALVSFVFMPFVALPLGLLPAVSVACPLRSTVAGIKDLLPVTGNRSIACRSIARVIIQIQCGIRDQ
jgi:hypothetical protein